MELYIYDTSNKTVIARIHGDYYNCRSKACNTYSDELRSDKYAETSLLSLYSLVENDKTVDFYV